jgi:hypothetical protein
MTDSSSSSSSSSAVPKPSGPPPTGQRYEGLPVPFFFQDKSAEKFIALSTKEDDVFLSSLPKGGTSESQARDRIVCTCVLLN